MLDEKTWISSGKAVNPHEAFRRQMPAGIPMKGKSSSGHRAAEEMLLLCAAGDISPGNKARIARLLAGPLDWIYFFKLAHLNGIAPLVAHNLTTNGLAGLIPDNCLKQLRQIYNSNLFRNVTLSFELKKVLSVFYQHNIEAIVLKGTMLAEYLFSNPALRLVGDMDILVPPEKLTQAGSLLREMGYRQMMTQQPNGHSFHEMPYYRMSSFPFIIELHWDLDDDRLVAFPQGVFWQRASGLKGQDSPGKLLSPEDYLIYLCNHLVKHSNHLLRLLSDIAELLKKYRGDFDWCYILASVHALEIENTVYYSLARSRELLGAPVPEFTVMALKPGAWRRWLLDFLIGRDFFFSGSRFTRIKENTFLLARGLMMPHLRQTALVLANSYRNKKVVWLRVVAWTILVFGAALGRNVAKTAFR